MADLDNWLSDFYSLNPDAIVDDGSISRPAKKEYKLDMCNSVLPAICRKNKSYYKNLNQEEKDSIEPWIIMRWLTSCMNNLQPHYLLTINDFVNVDFSRFSQKKSLGIEGHKELQWLLLTLCGTGSTANVRFMATPKGVVKNKIEEAVISYFPLIKDEDLELLLQINSKDELKEFFKDNGMPDKEIIELFKEKKKSK